MKLRAQLHRWPPLVLLQSCEQVPKRRHSLMSGGYTGGSRKVLRLGLLPSPLGPTFLPWHPGWPGTVWKPERQAQYAAFSVRTQRASSPQMLALAAQLVSLGSAKTESLGLGFGSQPLPAKPRPSTPGLTDAAALLVRAVPAVIEHVAAQRGGEAVLVPAQKLLLVFAVGGLGCGRLWGRAGLEVLGIYHPAPSSHWNPQSVTGRGGPKPGCQASGEAG